MIPVEMDGHVEIPRPQRLTPERRALTRLTESGLTRRVDVAVKQRGGRQGPREHLYFLTDARKGEAVVAAGELCGVGDPSKAKSDYGRGGLKGRHAKLRNDLLIRLIYDAAAARARGENVEVPLDECWAESCPDFPILGAKITHDEAGRRLDDFQRNKAGYEELVPDGRFRVEWGGGVSCTFDVELELGTRLEVVADKVDARAGAWLRHYEAQRERVQKQKQDREGNPYIRLADDYFSGFGPHITPVIFVYTTERRARNMRARLLARYPERYAELDAQLAGHGISAGSLFLFASLDTLMPQGVEGSGCTLDESYLPFDINAYYTTLAETAHYLAYYREPNRDF